MGLLAAVSRETIEKLLMMTGRIPERAGSVRCFIVKPGTRTGCSDFALDGGRLLGLWHMRTPRTPDSKPKVAQRMIQNQRAER